MFVGLLFAVLPPILLLVIALIVTESVLRNVDPNVVAVIVVVGAVLWAALLGSVFARLEADELRSIVRLAERGDTTDGSELGTAFQQLATALEERNRQVAALAREARAIPIDADPHQTVDAIVHTVRSVMRDTTWRAAVLTADAPDLLAPGVYVGDGGLGIAELGDLERWASSAELPGEAGRLEGPWGAFAIVHAAAGDHLRTILYAPWDGRQDLAPADVAVLSLVGQHAGTAIEHSMLFARVHRQADELQRLTRIQSDFLRGVTHDLQTPLTAIGALATELRADGSVPVGARADLETITHQAERLRRLVAQLLVASRLEAGAFTTQIEVFAVRPLIERVWTALRADRPFHLAESGPRHLAVGDPDRLEQVAWALLDNAVKYSPSGSPISVRIDPIERDLAVTVIDHGAGMDSEARNRAFDQFYRSDQARRMAPDGSGVGLYAARGIVEAMGGSIHLASEVGRGTSVTVRLPAEPVQAAE